MASDSQLSPIDARRLREQQMRQDRTGTRFEGQDRPLGPCYPRPALGARSGGLAWHRRGPAAGISADLPQPIRGPLLQRRAGRRFSGREGHRVRTRGKPPANSPTSAVAAPWRPSRGTWSLAHPVREHGQLHLRINSAAQDLCGCSACQPAPGRRGPEGCKSHSSRTRLDKNASGRRT